MSQSTQIQICTVVHEHTIIRCCTGPNFLAMLSLGSVALKAVITTVVFPSTQEMQSANVMPKAVCRSIQDQTVGSPMKVSGHRKHSSRESSSRELSSELLAFTMGVFLKLKKTTMVANAKQTPDRDTTVSAIPMAS